MRGSGKQVPRVDGEQIHAWAQLATQKHDAWDFAESGLRSKVLDQGLTILCQPGCVQCCFSHKSCSVTEAAAIVEWVGRNLDVATAEQLRLRVASAASSIAKLRAKGQLESPEAFPLSGGVECPFLQRGTCAIYLARPLECRIQMGTSGQACEQCFTDPEAVGTDATKELGRQLQSQLQYSEDEAGIIPPAGMRRRALIAEQVESLWARGDVAPSDAMTRESWRQRLLSRGGARDETWQDDRSDFRILKYPVTLPAEGDYEPDLTVVNLELSTQQLYDQEIQVQGLPGFPALYKREPGCHFDWERREFTWDTSVHSKMPYAVWMSDGVQERFMMWEAAKRCRGHVLCGGLGLGLFPQLALSLPQVQSVHIVDVDAGVIRLIERAWEQRPWPRREDCRTTHSPIEEFLRGSEEKYDTIYIDTWDAIYHEYLPHLNELSHLSRRLLRPGGEILLWAYDMMVRQFLDSAKHLLPRRAAFLQADKNHIEALRQSYPLLHKLVDWLRRHPACSDAQLLTRAYLLATQERGTLGILKLTATDVGGLPLLEEDIVRKGSH